MTSRLLFYTQLLLLQAHISFINLSALSFTLPWKAFDFSLIFFFCPFVSLLAQQSGAFKRNFSSPLLTIDPLGVVREAPAAQGEWLKPRLIYHSSKKLISWRPQALMLDSRYFTAITCTRDVHSHPPLSVYRSRERHCWPSIWSAALWDIAGSDESFQLRQHLRVSQSWGMKDADPPSPHPRPPLAVQLCWRQSQRRILTLTVFFQGRKTARQTRKPAHTWRGTHTRK